jgi:hypothetical protein
MHGCVIEAKAEQNLKSMVRLANLLRILWRSILKDSKLCSSLELDDNSRASLFNQIISGYSPPKS